MPDTAIPPGTWTQVSGLYSGDSNFQAAFAIKTATLTVDPAGSSTNLSLSVADVAYGSESGAQFTATVTPQYVAAGTPTGTVTVAEAGTTLCTIALSGGTGSCAMPDTALATGTYQVTGTYSGNEFFASSASGPQPLIIASAASATSLVVSPASVTYGKEQAAKFTATASSASPGTPGGTVTVAEFGTTLCTITLVSGTGTCTMPAAKLPAGNYGVIASYAGDSTFAASSSAVSKLTVTKERSATSLQLSAAALTFGHEHAERLTVQVKPQYPGAATGKVTITARMGKGKPIKVCVITLKSGKGSCALLAKALKPGTYALTATYGGTSGILSSNSLKKTLAVRK